MRGFVALQELAAKTLGAHRSILLKSATETGQSMLSGFEAVCSGARSTSSPACRSLDQAGALIALASVQTGALHLSWRS